MSQILAFICWMIQFYQYLTHNVLLTSDRDSWSSNGLAGFGHSFYLLLGAFLVVLCNIIILFTAVHLERKERRHSKMDDAANDDKMQGAIMLY